jgi:hypothetical protein
MREHTAYPPSLHIPLDTIKGIGPAKTNRLTGEITPLGTTQGPVHRAEAARLESPPATLNHPGVYQLQAVITLQGQEAAAGYRELQLVKVL